MIWKAGLRFPSRRTPKALAQIILEQRDEITKTGETSMHRLMVAAALSALSATALATAPGFAQSTQPAFPPAAYGQPPQTESHASPARRPMTIARPQPQHHLRQAARKHHVVHRVRRKKSDRQDNVQAIAVEQGYKKVSDLVHFPDFFPGLGIIYVKPNTLPLGPFLCFDRQRKLVATLYMVAIKDIDDHKTFEGTAPAFAPKVDHTTMYFNGGHPGMDMPHYHVVLWHVTKEGEQRVAQ
jgi:hypothetical protein